MRSHFPFRPDDPHYAQKMQSYQAQRRGRALTMGIVLLSVGAFVLLRRLRVVPDLHDLWPYGLVALSLLVGFRTRFRSPAFWVLLFLGASHAVPSFPVYGELSSRDLMLPLALLAGGAFLVLRKGSPANDPVAVPANGTPLQDAPLLDIHTVFGGRKELVTARNFAGGTVYTTFGGTELNLMQADAQTQVPVVLNLHVLFGGVELLVPAHWVVQNTISPVFGGVDDRRIYRSESGDAAAPVLVLKGSCVFGGIELKSY